MCTTYFDETVDLVPGRCEEEQRGPALADEGRGEGKIAQLKRTALPGHDLLHGLALRQDTLERHRQQFSQPDLGEVQPHLLRFAGTEVLCQCLVRRSWLLRSNFAPFCERWAPRHARFWSFQPDQESIAFHLGDPGTQNTFVHCVCSVAATSCSHGDPPTSDQVTSFAAE